MIVPSGAWGSPPAWGPHHLRLHRHLLRRPGLLPQEEAVLVAVSGGQDSMALTGLLRDLRPLHRWRLELWHGDHGWRAEAGDQAAELAAWADAHHLPLWLERADPPPGGEAAAREWRYRRLALAARRLDCPQVVTAHTASDRAETVLLNLARGAHRRGLSSLRACRELETGLRLVRPLLIFSREDTARFCREEGMPVWPDASNDDRRFGRNRLRAEVLPVLETLHPGACHRISAQAERLAEEVDQEEELLDLALTGIGSLPERSAASGAARAPLALDRSALTALAPASQRRLLQHWLRRRLGRTLAAAQCEALLARLPRNRGPGGQDLPGGWRLRWDGSTLALSPPDDFDG